MTDQEKAKAIVYSHAIDDAAPLLVDKIARALKEEREAVVINEAVLTDMLLKRWNCVCEHCNGRIEGIVKDIVASQLQILKAGKI